VIRNRTLVGGGVRLYFVAGRSTDPYRGTGMAWLPKDEKFFDLFEQLAKRLGRSAELLLELFENPSTLSTTVAAIKEVEHQADELTRTVIERIDRAFVTPLDREDIHLLASRLDEVIDLVDGTARRAQMFHLTEVREPARRLAGIIVRASHHIEEAVTHIKKQKIVQENSRELKVLEEEGDAVYHQAIGDLFRGNPDPLEVIKWKELYDKLEDTLDQCEDVANALESISIKNS
jgi:predicted phosphate transport protein (TIGR00153 family)